MPIVYAVHPVTWNECMICVVVFVQLWTIGDDFGLVDIIVQQVTKSVHACGGVHCQSAAIFKSNVYKSCVTRASAHTPLVIEPDLRSTPSA